MLAKTLKDLYKNGKYQEVLDQLTQKDSQGAFASLPEDEQIECLYYKSRSFQYLGQLEDALQVATAARANIVSLNDKTLTLAVLIAQLYALWKLGRLDDALEPIKEGTSIIEVLTAKERQTGKSWVALFENVQGNVYYASGDMDKALTHWKQSLAIREDIGNLQDIAGSLNNIGLIYRTKGELDKALEYYQRVLALYDKVGNPFYIALALNNIGDAYRAKGELDKALEYLQRSLALKEEIGNPQDIATTLDNIGIIYRAKGELDKALDCFQRSLALEEVIGNDIWSSYTLFYLILIALDQQDQTRAQAYLNQLQQLHARTPNKKIHLRSQLAEALVLKQSKRMREKAQAQVLLNQIVNEENIWFEWTALAIINYCDLLLFEVKSFGDPKVWAEAKTLILQFATYAQDQQLFPMIVEALLLRAKFATIEGELQQALKYYDQAKHTATEKNLDLLDQKIAEEKRAFEAEFEKWQELNQRNASLQERLNMAHLDDYIQDMLKVVAQDISNQMSIIPRRKYQLSYMDVLREEPEKQKNEFRVGIAQIGLPIENNFLNDYYEEFYPQVYGLKENKVEEINSKIKEIIKLAVSKKINILLFPELAIDLNYPLLMNALQEYSKKYNMYIIPGSYHDRDTRRNISPVISPEGILWTQEKHIPATITINGKRFTEGIEVGEKPQKTIVCDTIYGRIAIIICRDFMDMDLRVELKNSEPPIDLIFNPSFTPVIADFKAAHFDARRSIYAYCFFANIAEFGDSQIYSPEKERIERSIPKGEEGLIFKDVDIFKLRSERKKWELLANKDRAFIQSTR
ncbi:MAG: tetratricopeptide repeat protein [Candidatus Hermodarchaeia archaeon]|jgi:tetratricopeptide (TPR) repeat protein/predicted amidohydrolase